MESYFKSLLNDLISFSEDKNNQILQDKAFRVWLKCFRRGKKDLANKIAVKYKLDLSPKSDSAIALGWALIAEKKAKS